MRAFLSAAPGTVAAEGAANIVLLVMLRNELERHGIVVEVSRRTANDELEKIEGESFHEKTQKEETIIIKDAEQCNQYKPDVAVRIAGKLQGSGFEVYHQITDDWACYEASIKLAKLMQQQVQRYKMVYNRPPRAGVESEWLKRIRTPAVVCETYLNGETDILALLPDLRTQAKAYARAILMQLGVTYAEPQYGVARAAKMPEPTPLIDANEMVLDFLE